MWNPIEFYEILQNPVNLWNPADFSSNMVDLRWISDNGGFYLDLLQISFSDFNVNYIMDFICGFYGFHMKSTWFHMKDQGKVNNVTWINCSYWFQVDFITDFINSNTILLKPKWFHFMRFQMTSWNPTGFYKE